MSTRIALTVLGALFSVATCTQAQQPAAPESRPGLYDCDGCERAELFPAKSLSSTIDIAPADEPGMPLILKGRVFQVDGSTPAARVVLYFHQTNASGLYKSINSTGRGGPNDAMIEGWLATGADGRYEVATVQPAPYPNLGAPAHIHVYVKEPGRRPYYIDDFVFEGDSLVTERYRADQQLRGGSGIVKLVRGANGVFESRRDIVLER